MVTCTPSELATNGNGCAALQHNGDCRRACEATWWVELVNEMTSHLMPRSVEARAILEFSLRHVYVMAGVLTGLVFATSLRFPVRPVTLCFRGR